MKRRVILLFNLIHINIYFNQLIEKLIEFFKLKLKIKSVVNNNKKF